MHNRPLLSATLAYAGGILIGHFFASTEYFVPSTAFALLALFILACVGSILLFPHRMRTVILPIVFFAAGSLLDLQTHDGRNLSAIAESGEEVVVRGTVEEPQKTIDDFSRIVLRPDFVSKAGKEITPSGRLLVQVYSHSRVFSPGDTILFRARLRPFRNYENPGRYDYALAMSTKGFVCTASVPDGRGIVPLGKGSLGPAQAGLEAVRSPLRKFMKAELYPWQAAVFRALILGEMQDVDPELRDLFTRTGLGHVLAVSGLNIGLIAGIAFMLIKSLLALSYRLSLSMDIRKAAAMVTCIPVVGYSLLAGFEVSVQRAMVMVLAYLLSIVFDREKEIWSTLSIAALIILAVHPHEVFSISFQLSFGGVIGLVVMLPEVKRVLEPFVDRVSIGRIPYYLVGLAVSTIAATLFLLPVIMYYFSRISIVTVPANLMALPFLGVWILPVGLLAAIVLPFSSLFAGLLLQLGSLGIDLILMIMQFWSGLSFAEVWVVRPSLLEIGLFYGILICILYLKRVRYARVCLALLLLILTGDVFYWIQRTQFNSHLRVTYLDVGSGHAALVQFPGRKRMLIDGGGSPSDDFDIGRMVVAPSLLALKIRRVDYLVLSHPESDHMNGLPFIASHFKPREFWHNGDRVDSEPYRDLMAIVREKGIRERLSSEMREPLEIGNVRIEILHPGSEGAARRTKLNDRSIVLRLVDGENSFLFPGDLQKEGEDTLIPAKGSMLRSDVLLVPHHGSRTSCSEEFLAMVNPSYCIISARGGIPLRFPHPDLLKRLESRGCTVFRTDRQGAITVSSRGERFEIETFKEGLFKAALR